MIHETDDDRLDQSLRDTFSDFDLPPSGHVWSGVEGRLAAQPGPPRQVPLLLLLPAVALVGVAVGWLLPSPSAAPPTPPAASTIPVASQPAAQARPLSAAKALAHTAVLPPPSTPAFRATPSVAAKQPEQLAVGVTRNHVQPHQASRTQAPAPTPMGREAAANQAPQLFNVTASSAIAPQIALEAPLPPIAATTPTDPLQQDTAGSSAPAAYTTNSPAQSGKAENRQEWRPEYRKPKHRLAERGLGVRRFRNNISKQWQRLFGPRRATRTPQPAS